MADENLVIRTPDGAVYSLPASALDGFRIEGEPPIVCRRADGSLCVIPHVALAPFRTSGDEVSGYYFGGGTDNSFATSQTRIGILNNSITNLGNLFPAGSPIQLPF